MNYSFDSKTFSQKQPVPSLPHPFCEHMNTSALVMMAANIVICLCCTCLSQEPLKVTINRIPGQHFITTYRQEFLSFPTQRRGGGDGDTELRGEGWEASAIYHRGSLSYQWYASMQDAMCRVGPNHVPNIFLVTMSVVSGLCKGIIRSHDNIGLFFLSCSCLKSGDGTLLSSRYTLVQKPWVLKEEPSLTCLQFVYAESRQEAAPLRGNQGESSF